jgi:hypothetical protein
MAIYKELGFYEFVDEFINYDRNYFTLEGYEALYNYLSDDYEDDLPLDVIGIVCEFTEYENFKQIKDDYDIETLDDLRDITLVLDLESGGFVIQNF